MQRGVLGGRARGKLCLHALSYHTYSVCYLGVRTLIIIKRIYLRVSEMIT